MLEHINFKHTALAQSVRFILNVRERNKLICASILLSIYISPAVHAENQSVADDLSQLGQVVKNQAITPDATHKDQSQSTSTSAVQPQTQSARSQNTSTQATEQNSEALLQQQEQTAHQLDAFKPIEFKDLDNLPDTQVDASMANEIFSAAEQAQRDANASRNELTQNRSDTVHAITTQELAEINQAPVNIDSLMRQIQSEQSIDVKENPKAPTLNSSLTAENIDQSQSTKKVGFFKRMLYKIRPSLQETTDTKVARIEVSVTGAPTALADNISAKLSSYTQEAFDDFSSSLPQLRSLSNQAAQAVGYYNATFKFKKLSDSKLQVAVTPNEPVKVAKQDIEFSGEGAKTPQFQVIRLIPDLDIGDILNQGKYEQTKSRITEAASDNGYFDAYWRLHDLKIAQPDNTADITLKYETGERYTLGNVEFRMSDPSKKLPLKMKVLRSMVPWKNGDDYTYWRVNTLANNLTNSRYFNNTLVDTVKPDPIEKPLELPSDIQALVDQQKIEQQDAQSNKVTPTHANQEVTQHVIDESQFAGLKATDEENKTLQALQKQKEQKQDELDALQEQARADKKVPVIVTLNADHLNSVETGIGYGTDTSFRIRSQYRRAIVNSLGHSFDANLELSKIRQSIDGRYSIPYKDPINDYINLVGGYERELLDDVGPDVSLETDSAVIGAERVIKNPMGGWQQTFGFRYRLDRISQKGEVDTDDIPDAFKVPGSDPNQQSLLFGYEISKTLSNNKLNPTKGFKQSYKIQLGSKSLVSDADMAILTAGWHFIYSLGDNDDHQFVGRTDLSYMFTNDFDKVPYNLRFFAGGDQTIRGFDYKSLSPTEYGYKVGGQALAVGSLEYNYQFKEGWRAAIFTDFGNAYDEKFDNGTAYSLGVGLRWKSPIGPIRIDVASGLSDDNHPIRLHFFIGSQL